MSAFAPLAARFSAFLSFPACLSGPLKCVGERGPTPFYLYNQYLNSAQIGQGKFNFVAWNNAATDNFLKQYASTSDVNAQKQAIMGIEQVFVRNQPFIPLWTGADYREYTTTHFTGWPDQKN